jgi:hypothetical protein
VLERLVAARLLVRDRRKAEQLGIGDVVVEIVHEALLRQWLALSTWLDADADALQRLEAVRRAAAEWVRHGKAPAWLVHTAERLAAAEELRHRAHFEQSLREPGQAYLAACRDKVRAAGYRGHRDRVMVDTQIG